MRDALIGTWILESCAHVPEGGPAELPYGPDPDGVLVYAADGGVAVAISARGRPGFSGGDPRRATDAEKARALDASAAYAGTWSVEGDAVLHHVRASPFADWVGTTQRRLVRWRGDRLVLATPPIPVGGVLVVAELVWRRPG